jgi:hypothetical protein
MSCYFKEQRINERTVRYLIRICNPDYSQVSNKQLKIVKTMSAHFQKVLFRILGLKINIYLVS